MDCLGKVIFQPRYNCSLTKASSFGFIRTARFCFSFNQGFNRFGENMPKPERNCNFKMGHYPNTMVSSNRLFPTIYGIGEFQCFFIGSLRVQDDLCSIASIEGIPDSVIPKLGLGHSPPGLWDQGVSPHFCDTRESPFI